MISLSRKFVRLIYLLIDVACILLAIYIACKIRQPSFTWEVTYYTLFLDANNPFRYVFVTWVIASVLSLNSRALYETKRELLGAHEIVTVFRAIFYSTVVTILITYMFKFQGFPRGILLLGTIFILLFLSVWRTAKRMFVGYLVAKKGYNNSNAVIVGANSAGLALYEEMNLNPELGIKVIGFIDDAKSEHPKELPPILGTYEELAEISKRHFISKIYVSDDLSSFQIAKVGEVAKEVGAAFLVVPQGYTMINGNFTKHYLRTIPVLEYSQGASFRFQIGKRLFDIILASIAILCLSPVLLLVSILVSCTSKGGIIHVSKRYGRAGQVFLMYKFRSMYKDAEQRLADLKDKNEVDGPIFKIKKDPRITPVGYWLRRYSLDELPQLFNVILGDMSLVGPRPFLVEHVESEDLNQWRRLEVKPGITGLWQIKGRNDVSFQKLLRLDSWYIDNWSYWLDIVILLQTIPAVIKARGAY